MRKEDERAAAAAKKLLKAAEQRERRAAAAPSRNGAPSRRKGKESAAAVREDKRSSSSSLMQMGMPRSEPSVAGGSPSPGSFTAPSTAPETSTMAPPGKAHNHSCMRLVQTLQLGKY